MAYQEYSEKKRHILLSMSILKYLVEFTSRDLIMVKNPSIKVKLEQKLSPGKLMLAPLASVD